MMPELPSKHKAALALGVKLPLFYVNVATRNWQSLVKLGVDEIYSPYGFFCSVKLNYPVSLGASRDPDDPILVHMVHVPLTPNQGFTDVPQFLGRQRLLDTSFDEFENQITGQLDRILGPGGFQSARDIAEITVNRSPHGYAYAAWNGYTHEAIDQVWRAVNELKSA